MHSFITEVPSLYFKPKYLSDIQSWHGHVYFVHDLISEIKPSNIVELGVHKGDSLFSMAQSCNDLNCKTTLYGIDHWKGDSQAGKVDDEIFSNVFNISKNYFKNVTLIKSSFDDALKSFDDDSLDIIHIDGYHSYEASKNDFESWIPKLKEDGVLLMHDVFSLNDDFGVVDFWNEIKREFTTVEFEHSQGLGVIFNSGFKKKTNYFKRLLNPKYLEFFKIYYSLCSTKLRIEKLSDGAINPFEKQMYLTEYMHLKNACLHQSKKLSSIKFPFNFINV
jgi:hypothetical protein